MDASFNGTPYYIWEPPLREVKLRKGKHSYVVRYAKGGESQALAAIRDMAERRDMEFDWYDAALMAHEMGRKAGADIRAELAKHK